MLREPQPVVAAAKLHNTFLKRCDKFPVKAAKSSYRAARPEPFRFSNAIGAGPVAPVRGGRLDNGDPGLRWLRLKSSFEIDSFSFSYGTTTPQKRTTCVVYYTSINGVAMISGVLLGSTIGRVNAVFWSIYLLVFLVSGIFRIASSLFLLTWLRQVRTMETI